MKKTIFLLFTFWAFAVSFTVNADPAYYLIGQFNEWDQNATVPFVLQDDGSFVLTQTFSGLFKVKNENGDWLGGQANNQDGNQCVLTYDNPSADLIDGANFFIVGSDAEYTLTIANGVLTVMGLPEHAYYLYGKQFSNWGEPIAFTELKDGSFTLTRTISGLFKVVNEKGNWYGGNTEDGSDYWLTSENPSVTLSTSGSNLFFNGGAACYTLTIADGVLTATGFGTPPRPHDPKAEDWIDYGWFEYEDPETGEIKGFGGGYFQFSIVTENKNHLQPVADDWTYKKEDNEEYYSLLDPNKVTYSIFTDYDKLLTFMPEDFTTTMYDGDGNPIVVCDIPEPTTEIPFNFLGESHSFFEYGDIFFETKKFSNEVEGQEPFFKYRIGIQVHYTVDGVKSSSNIVYLYPFDEYPEIPVLKGDVNFDGKVDVTDVNILVNIILGKDSADKYDGRAYITEGDTNVDVSDVNEEVNILLGKTSK